MIIKLLSHDYPINCPMIILLIVPWLSYELSHDYPINYPMIILSG